MYHEFEWIQMEAVISYLQILYKYVPGRTEENHGTPQNSLCPG
jgi:hypothetical protein